jgi:hypothetical protein
LTDDGNKARRSQRRGNAICYRRSELSADRSAIATRSRPEYDGPNGRHERPVVDPV